LRPRDVTDPERPGPPRSWTASRFRHAVASATSAVAGSPSSPLEGERLLSLNRLLGETIQLAPVFERRRPVERVAVERVDPQLLAAASAGGEQVFAAVIGTPRLSEEEHALAVRRARRGEQPPIRCSFPYSSAESRRRYPASSAVAIESTRSTYSPSR